MSIGNIVLSLVSFIAKKVFGEGISDEAEIIEEASKDVGVD